MDDALTVNYALEVNHF